MKRLVPVIVIGFLLLPAWASAQRGRLIENPIRNVPRWVRDAFAAKHMDRDYTLMYRLFPHTFRGDFDGDARRDVVVQITQNATKKYGIAIFHAKRPQALFVNVTIVGAGKDFGGAGDNLDWVNLWNIIPRGKLAAMGYRGITDAEGDLILLEKRGGKRGLVYWDGRHYTWHLLHK